MNLLQRERLNEKVLAEMRLQLPLMDLHASDCRLLQAASGKLSPEIGEQGGQGKRFGFRQRGRFGRCPGVLHAAIGKQEAGQVATLGRRERTEFQAM
jgi:hypothetical protein